ncbi:MAG TPA: ATP-binding protein [Syntrophomonadaceae bacterium]|nr:ATP-binding protein [Syntrophomonadaceae bacterium]
MKGKLVILIGPPAAGKSTWLYQFSGEVISTDDIRRQEFGVQFDQRIEPAVWHLAYERLEKAIRSGKDVCFDATNTTRNRRKPLIDIAKKYGVSVEGVVFLWELDVLIKRNRERPPGKKVPEEVIENKLQELEVPSYEEGFNKIEVFR